MRPISPTNSKTFMDQSVTGLAQDGKIISVRLALFAEMVKGKPWTPATLKEVGGTEGVGCDLSRRDLQRLDRPSRASAPSESRPGGSQSSASRDRHRHQGTDEVTTRNCWKRRVMPTAPETSTT